MCEIPPETYSLFIKSDNVSPFPLSDLIIEIKVICPCAITHNNTSFITPG